MAMDFNESLYRYSLDPAGLNATIRDTLVSSSSLKIHPFTGNEDVNEWIGDFEMLAYAAEWSDETKAKKFPMYLRGGAACWYRVNYPNDCEKREPYGVGSNRRSSIISRQQTITYISTRK